MSVYDTLNKLRSVKRCANGWTARCPAHEDHHNSLSISEGDGERILLYCHAGCEYERIISALGVERENTSRRIVAIYDYQAEDGSLLYQSVRYDPKGFVQRCPDGAGWTYKLNGTRRVLYSLPQLLTSKGLVFNPEGEKDCNRLAALGLMATTNAGGAGKWRDEYSQYLRGRDVVILPDNDEPGRNHALQVALSLHGIASSIRIVELPGLPPKGDVSDWLDAGGTKESLLALVESASEWKPTAQDESALRIMRMADVERQEVHWLWHPYIALGKLTILEGDPGLGKSWLTCALASGVTNGRGLPGAGLYEAGNVLMLSAEDGLADTLRPRLDAVEADVSRVFALAEPLTFDMPGLVRLEAAIIEHKPVLVIVDPLFAFTGGKVDIHRANECRAISAPLAAIAERRGCAIVAVRHLGKSRGGGHALNAGIGSIDFAAAARSVLLVGADPNEPSRRAIVHIKSNLALPGASVGFKLDADGFYWTGESDLTAGLILAASSTEEERGSVAEARDFLRIALSDGARDSKAIKDEAKQAGIFERTLMRAKKDLQVKSEKVGMPGSRYQKWVWRLPSAEGCQTAEDCQTSDVGSLRTNEPNKDSYSNNLAEGCQTLKLGSLQDVNEMYFPRDLDLDALAARTAQIAKAQGISEIQAESMALAEMRAERTL